jgi:hypothetical protein
MNEQLVIERLSSALEARTAHVDGRPDSLELLLLDPRRRGQHRPVMVTAALVTAVAAAVVGILVVSTTLRGPASSTQPARQPDFGSAFRITTGTTDRFPANAYFVTRQVTKLTKDVMDDRPVIARTSDLAVVHALPLSLTSAQLSADGSRVFGYYFGSHGGEGTDNSATTDKRVRTLVTRDSAAHAVYYDLATGDVVELGKARFPGITGMTVTPDGRTVAYARIDTRGGDHTIIRVIDVGTGTGRDIDVPRPHQVLKLALSPDGKRLAFTETESGNILFLAELSQPDAAATATAVVPPQPCLKGAYDYPTWNDQGLFAARECEPDAHGMVSDVVRLDPQTLLPVGDAVAQLPDGGVTSLVVLTTPDGLAFGYSPARPTEPIGDQNDARVLFRENEMWLLEAGSSAGHRTGLLWGP